MKNRFNVVRPTPDYTPKKKEEAVIFFENCCVCGVIITVGYYGRFSEGGVCSKHCNTIREQLPLFGEQDGHPLL